MRISENARRLALMIWAEQAASGIGPATVDPAQLDDWLVNRTYPLTLLEQAASGDVAALLEIRIEAGLPAIV